MKYLFSKIFSFLFDLIILSFAALMVYVLIISILLDHLTPRQLFGQYMFLPIAILFLGIVVFFTYRLTFRPKALKKSSTKKKKRSIRAKLIVILLPLVALASILGGMWYYDRIESARLLDSANSHFTIIVHKQVPQDRVDNTLVELEKQLVRLSKKYGADNTDIIMVNLYNNPAEYQDASQPEWSGGSSGIQHGNPVINLIAEQGGNFFTRTEATTTPAHELTHIILCEIVGQNVNQIPLWFNEGLAEYESNKGCSNLCERAYKRFSLWLLKTEITNSYPTISYFGSYPAEKSEIFPFYATSFELVRYIVKTANEDTPIQILMMVRDGESFEHAIYAKIDISSEELYNQWLKSFF